MPYIDFEMDVFDDDDLVYELRNRGYYISDSAEDNHKMINDLFKILKSFQCDDPKVFEKNMRIFYDQWYPKLS